MLGLIIEDELEKSWSQLYLNKNEKGTYFSGFTICDGILCEFSKKELAILDNFKLGQNRKKVESIDDCEVILDETTGLYHFFKDGKEDFMKLFYANGKNATLYDGENKKDPLGTLYKFFFKHQSKVILVSLSMYLALIGSTVFKTVDALAHEPFDVYYNGEVISGTKNELFDTISFTYEGIDKTVGPNLTSEDIQKLIYSSDALHQVEKDFLWNQELIELLLPYYNKDTSKVLILVKHTGLNIKSFTSKEREGSSGFYVGDNTLHILDYDMLNIIERKGQAKVVGHEYAHLLQNSKYAFINEAAAEIMAHEFYMSSSDTSLHYSYNKACKHLKVLMEIVGTDPILDTMCNYWSDSLYEAVIPYISEEEYVELSDILKLSPFYDSEELEDGKYTRLYELLGKLYENKFGRPIDKDKMINSIMKEYPYNRVYFCPSLREKEADYYPDLQAGARIYTLEDACQEGKITIQATIEVTKEQYDSYMGTKGTKNEIISSKIIDTKSVDNRFVYTVTQEDGSTRDMTTEEAEKLGLISIKYSIIKNVSYWEYISDELVAEFGIMGNIYYAFYSPNSLYIYDSKSGFVVSREDIIKVNIENIVTKFNTNQKSLS